MAPLPQSALNRLEAARSQLQDGLYRDAVAAATQVAEQHGEDPASCYLRLVGMMCLGESKVAVTLAERAVRKYSRHPELLAASGAVMLRAGQLDQALAWLEQAVALDPELAEGWIQLTTLQLTLKNYAAAGKASAHAIRLAPRDVTALTHQAALRKLHGDPQGAIAALREVAALSPAFYAHRCNLLYFMLFDSQSSPADLRREAESCGQLLAAAPAPAPAHDTGVRPRTDGRVRLGLLSNDLRQHACAYFLIPLLAHLDRARFEVVCLSLHPVEDRVTDKIRQYSDRFVSLAGQSADDIITAVRAEGLDALIDLGGHTEHTPLQYMAHGLAPVQLTWLGYPGTTGVQAIGFRITDEVADPAGNEPFYTETLLRAPGVFCPYAPLVQAPLRVFDPAYRVAPTPALRNGFITFGSCNNLNKLTPATLHLWSAVLRRCPDSRLLVEAADALEQAVRVPLLARMAETGIDPGRVTLVPRDSARQYLTYHDIDIVLDAFPLTGGTTTCDALWMGVPVVTLTGAGFHSRMSATFLHAVELDWLACPNADAYVDAAAQLAADATLLDALRQSIRPRFEAATVDYAASFARWLEDQLVSLTTPHRSLALPPATAPDAPETFFFGGRGHGVGEVLAAIGVLLERQDYDALQLMLEYICARRPRHWVVAFALAKMAHTCGDLASAVEKLMEAVALHPHHAPLYGLLAAWMDQGGYDKQELADFLAQQFGVALADLEAQPLPGIAAVLGF